MITAAEARARFVSPTFRPVAVGAIVALASLVFPLSHDEAVWVTVVERLGRGDRLYLDIIDNKSPLVFAVVWLVERAPGAFPIARGLLVGCLASVLVISTARVSSSLGLSHNLAWATGILVGVAAPLVSAFWLSTELLALAAFVLAMDLMLQGALWLTVLAALAAVGFDPRSILLIPGLLLLAREWTGASAARRLLWRMAPLVLLAVGTILLVPDLRYSLFELNLGSRPAFDAAQHHVFRIGAAALRGLLALVGVLALIWLAGEPSQQHRRLRSGWVLAGAAILTALISFHPYEHYWVLPFAAAPVLSMAAPVRPSKLWAVSLALLALFGLVTHASKSRQEQQTLLSDYRMATEIAEQALRPGDTFVSFDVRPYLSTFLPEYLGMRAPTASYLAWGGWRQPQEMEEFRVALRQAEMVSDDGGLSSSLDMVRPPARPIWQVIQAELNRFPCMVALESVTLHFTLERCPLR